MTPAPSAAQPFDGDLQRQLIARYDLATEAHILDAAEQREAVRVVGMGQEGHCADLSQGFQLQDPGHHGSSGEVPGEPRFIAAYPPTACRSGAWLAGIDGVHEAERRSMWEQGNETIQLVSSAP